MKRYYCCEEVPDSNEPRKVSGERKKESYKKKEIEKRGRERKREREEKITKSLNYDITSKKSLAAEKINKC